MADALKAISQISKRSDKKEDVLLIMKANENWDRFFIPAPLAISLLGAMLYVSVDRDISLRQSSLQESFKLLKFPDSLRACLVQVSNEGWMVFNEAHTSMDQICLLSSNVESHIRNSVKFLLGGSVSEIENVLPTSLSKVEEMADSCLELASKTEAKFIQVMELTAEILEACTASKGYYEEQQQENETALKVARKLKELTEERQKEPALRLETTLKEVEKAQEKFDSAFKDIPSTGEMDSLKSAISTASLSNPKRLAVSAVQSLTGLVHSSKPKGQNDQSLSDEITGNVRFKTEVAKQMLSETEEKHNKAYAELQAETGRLHASLLEMQSLDITKIIFDEIRSTLSKGIKALAEVICQRSRLCNFFFSDDFKPHKMCSLHSTLKTFVVNSRKSSEIKLQGESISNVYKEMF